MTTRPNIYVTHRGDHNYEAARDFGDLVFLTEGLVDKFQTDKIYRLMKPILEVSEPSDFILLSGLTVLSSIACAMFAARHDRLNLLVYQGYINDYKARHLDFSDLQDQSMESFLKKVREG